MNTKLKPRLNTQKNTRPNRAVWSGPGSCALGKPPMYSLNARDHFNYSPLHFSWPAPWNRCSQTERGATAFTESSSNAIKLLLLVLAFVSPANFSSIHSRLDLVLILLPKMNICGLLVCDFYRPDVFPVIQPTPSKHWMDIQCDKKTEWNTH